MADSPLLETEGSLPSTLGRQLLMECRSMVEFALGSGRQLPEDIVPLLLRAERALRAYRPDGAGPETETALAAVGSLATIHNRLVTVVAPAVPRAIVILQKVERRSTLGRLFGAIGLVRYLVLIALVSLVAFIGLSLSPQLDEAIQIHDLLLQLEGLHLLIILSFLLAAASIGAAFEGLFRANRYIERGTFDPRFETSYWIRFGLGVLSGILLSTLIPLDPELTLMGRPTLAMVGGFSSDLLYQIIQRLIDAIGSIFKGGSSDAVAAPDAQPQPAGSIADAELRQSLVEQWLQLRAEATKNGDADVEVVRLIDDSIATLRR